MKKIYIFSLAIFSLSFFLISCSNELNEKTEKKETATNSFDLKEMVENFNNQGHQNIPARYYSGSLDFGISNENLVILVGDNGNYKTSYVIQLNKELLTQAKALQAGNFELAFLASELILVNGKQNLIFTVDEEKKYEETGLNAKIFNAVGIVNWSNKSLETSSSKAMAFKLVDDGATCTCKSLLEPIELCKNGGEGSSSCSKGDCGVTCKSGYYACCNE